MLKNTLYPDIVTHLHLIICIEPREELGEQMSFSTRASTAETINIEIHKWRLKRMCSSVR